MFVCLLAKTLVGVPLLDTGKGGDALIADSNYPSR